MRLLIKLIALVILGPIALILFLLAVAAAIVGIPLLWEKAVASFTAPPERKGETR